MSTILKLQAELEELEKRIKAISMAQNSLVKLNEISEYFKTVQTYLTMLNEDFNNHLIQSNEYSTQINNLQGQIATLTDQVGQIAGGSGIDLTQIENAITTLSQELAALKNGSTATILSLEEHIENLEGEHDLMEENISQNSTDISTINQIISEMQTTLTNITTTQNSLSSTQSNLTSTVAGINSRLTKAEANISTLTEGVDVAYLDERISNLEISNSHMAYKQIKFNITPNNNMMHSKEIYFYSTANYYIIQKIKLNYVATNAGTLNVSILINKQIKKEFAIDLSKYPNGYEIDLTYMPIKKYQIISINFSSTEAVTYSDIELIALGQGIHYLNYNPNVRIHCFNNEIYITKIENGIAYYDVINSTDELNLDELRNQMPLVNEDHSYVDFTLIPYIYAKTVEQKYDDYTIGFIAEKTDGTQVCGVSELSNTTNSYFVDRPCYNYAHADYVFGNYYYEYVFYIDPETQLPSMSWIRSYNNYKEFVNNGNVLSGSWLGVFGIHNNNTTLSHTPISTANCMVISLFEDGYMYLIPAQTPTYKTKIAKGVWAAAYHQLDGGINVYIYDNKSIKKYNLKKGTNLRYEPTYITTIDDCDYIYETFNNTIVKHNISTNSWVVDTLEY